jgi:hypothetical protein
MRNLKLNLKILNLYWEIEFDFGKLEFDIWEVFET